MKHRKLLGLPLILILVFTFALTAAISVEESSAGPCENCWAYCYCHYFWQEGRIVNTVCDLDALCLTLKCNDGHCI